MIYSFYVPVEQCFLNRINDAIESGVEGEIEYYSPDFDTHAYTGIIDSCLNIPNKGVYIVCKDHKMIRVDRLIKIFGLHGPAWRYYNQNTAEPKQDEKLKGPRT